MTASVRDNNTITTISPVKWADTLAWALNFTSAGAGAAAFNQLCIGVLSIAAGTGTTGTIDLAGSLTNVLNDASVSFARVKIMIVKLLSATDTEPQAGTACSSIRIGAGSNPFPGWFVDVSDKLELTNGEILVLGGTGATGHAVTAGTGDIVTFENRDNSVAAKIFYAFYGATS